MALASIMLAPRTNVTYIAASGAGYISDSYGIIENVAVTDVASLVQQGCAILTPPPTNLLGELLLADFNSIGDQQIPLLTNAKYRVTRVVVTNATHSLTTAAGGLYTAGSKGGTALVAAGQVYTACTGLLTAQDCTMNSPATVCVAGGPLFLSLTTGQGVACTADVYVYGDTYS